MTLSISFIVFIRKQLVFLLVAALPVAGAAQLTNYVEDKEGLFTTEETQRLDSLLGQYHRSSGKVVLIATDSAEISNPGYKSGLFGHYFPDSNSHAFVMMLLMSRKNQLIQLVASKTLLPYFTQQRLLEILDKGIPSLKAKRREEGATLICKAAMGFMDGLPDGSSKMTGKE